MQLKVIQNLFADYIFNNNINIIEHISSPKSSLSKRLSIYQDNILFNLKNTLKALYPALLNQLSSMYSENLLEQYILTHKPTSGNLDNYGDKMPLFLKTYKIANKKCLIDLAKFELALHHAFYAEDNEPLDTKALANIPSKSYESLKFKMHPSFYLFKSDYPIYEIWQNNINKTYQQKLFKSKSYILIHREGFLIKKINIGPGEYNFLKSINKDCTLAEAYMSASIVDVSFDLSDILQKYIINNVIIEILT